MNKKASAFDTVVDLLRILCVIVVFLSVWFITNTFLKQSISTYEVESKLLTNRIFLSKELNYFDDDTKRLYVGVIDFKKFLSDDFEKNILNSIYYGDPNSRASTKITLVDTESDTMYFRYYNRELYGEKKVLVEAELTGKGSASRLGTDFYVLIMDNGKIRHGVLNIDTILPNS